MQIYTSITDPALADTLRRGGVGVLPTDTVYGLAAQASNREASARLYQLKQRDSKPGTLIAASLDQLIALGLKRRYLLPVADYWPGAVSVVIPCDPLPDLGYLHLGAGSLAVRLPANQPLQELLALTGPLLTSSANLPGQPPAGTVAAAKAYFGSTVDFYTTGLDLSAAQPSTVIRVIDDAIQVLRPGAVEIKEEA